MLKLPENDRKRIAIFTTDDKIWALPVWAKTIPEFEVDYEVIGIYLFPEHFKKMKGTEIPSFYLKTFGVWNFILLGLYALKTAALALFSRTNSWKSLSVTHGLQLNKGDTPNSMEVRTWLKENNIDIVFIFLNDILKSDTLAAATYGFINKHAGLLPSARGVFPFFWAKLRRLPTGITFHQVDAGIDTGRILCQAPYPKDAKTDLSMLRFYMDTYFTFPRMAALSAKRLLEGKYQDPVLPVKDSYFGFPNKQDFKKYKAMGFKVARFSDLFYTPRLEEWSSS